MLSKRREIASWCDPTIDFRSKLILLVAVPFSAFRREAAIQPLHPHKVASFTRRHSLETVPQVLDQTTSAGAVIGGLPVVALHRNSIRQHGNTQRGDSAAVPDLATVPWAGNGTLPAMLMIRQACDVAGVLLESVQVSRNRTCSQSLGRRPQTNTSQGSRVTPE